jgi:hypothetical protein
MTQRWSAVWLCLLLVTGAPAAHADGVIETPAFILKLPGKWVAAPGSDAAKRSYYSKKLDVGLTASFVMREADPGDTAQLAQRLRDVRLAGEQQVAAQFNYTLDLVDPVIVAFARGHQVAYQGQDSNGRQFRYLGLVLPTKTIQIYLESKTRSQPELEGIFNELLTWLRF